MFIVALAYILLAWAIFSHFRLLPWNWAYGIITGLIGGLILGVFLALFNTMTPSGRIDVVGRVVEVTPKVMGTVTIETEPST